MGVFVEAKPRDGKGGAVCGDGGDEDRSIVDLNFSHQVPVPGA